MSILGIEVDKDAIMNCYEDIKTDQGFATRKIMDNKHKSIISKLKPIKKGIQDKAIMFNGIMTVLGDTITTIDDIRDTIHDPDLKGIMGLHVPDDMKVQLVIGKSIVSSLPNLPLHYTRNIADSVTQERAIAILMMNKHVTKTKAIAILKEIYDKTRGWTWDNPSRIFYIKDISPNLDTDSSDSDSDSSDSDSDSSDSDSE
jgi:hypothetical protein